MIAAAVIFAPLTVALALWATDNPRLRARAWWWLAPSHARPEARHDLRYWRARQLSLDLAIAFPAGVNEAMAKMARAVEDVTRTLANGLVEPLRQAAAAIAKLGEWLRPTMEAVEYMAIDREAETYGDGWPPGRLW